CTDCGLVFLNPMPSDEELMGMYPTEYYAYQDEPKSGRLKQFCKLVLGYWQGVKDPHFEKPGVLLDIGCGSGAHMLRMRQRGWEVYGVEINDAAAKIGTSKGLQIFSGNLRDARFQSQFFDYVRASHSLEHITDPRGTLEEIHRVLKPDGKFLVAVPNVDSLSARVFKQYWWHLCPPVHVYGYSSATLFRF